MNLTAQKTVLITYFTVKFVVYQGRKLMFASDFAQKQLFGSF